MTLIPSPNLNPLLRTTAVLLLSTSLAGCSALIAQNPSSNLKPVNAVADNPEDHLLLKGADVVAYFTQNKYVQGSPPADRIGVDAPLPGRAQAVRQGTVGWRWRQEGRRPCPDGGRHGNR